MADFPAGGLQHFFVDFASVLIRKMRGVLYLVIEEAHEFAPKERTGVGQENLAIHWAKKLATAGRSKGIRLILLSQRTQALHNALLGSCDTLIAHRFTAPADQAPVVQWLKANVEPEIAKRVAASLSSLKTGEGWICSGEAKIFEQRQFPRIHTYDNTATPTGDSHEHAVKTAPVDAEKLRQILGDAVKEAEENDVARLKARIRQLETEREQERKHPLHVVDPKATQEAEERGYHRGRAEALAETASYAHAVADEFTELSQKIMHTAQRYLEHGNSMERKLKELPKAPGAAASTGPAEALPSTSSSRRRQQPAAAHPRRACLAEGPRHRSRRSRARRDARRPVAAQLRLREERQHAEDARAHRLPEPGRARADAGGRGSCHAAEHAGDRRRPARRHPHAGVRTAVAHPAGAHRHLPEGRLQGPARNGVRSIRALERLREEREHPALPRLHRLPGAGPRRRAPGALPPMTRQDERAELTGRQIEVLAFIRASIASRGMPPTRAEISGHFGFRSMTAAQQHLEVLERKGKIRLDKNGASRGIQIVGHTHDGQILADLATVRARTIVEALVAVESFCPKCELDDQAALRRHCDKCCRKIVAALSLLRRQMQQQLVRAHDRERKPVRHHGHQYTHRDHGGTLG
jgi:hypothetical protein